MTKTIKVIILICSLLACITMGIQVGMSKIRAQQAQEHCLEQGATGYITINSQVYCIYE